MVFTGQSPETFRALKARWENAAMNGLPFHLSYSKMNDSGTNAFKSSSPSFSSMKSLHNSPRSRKHGKGSMSKLTAQFPTFNSSALTQRRVRQSLQPISTTPLLTEDLKDGTLQQDNNEQLRKPNKDSQASSPSKIPRSSTTSNLQSGSRTRVSRMSSDIASLNNQRESILPKLDRIVSSSQQSSKRNEISERAAYTLASQTQQRKLPRSVTQPILSSQPDHVVEDLNERGLAMVGKQKFLQAVQRRKENISSTPNKLRQISPHLSLSSREKQRQSYNEAGITSGARMKKLEQDIRSRTARQAGQYIRLDSPEAEQKQDIVESKGGTPLASSRTYVPNGSQLPSKNMMREYSASNISWGRKYFPLKSRERTSPSILPQSPDSPEIIREVAESFSVHDYSNSPLIMD